MKAWQVHQFGTPREMTLAEVPTPAPKPGQVLIRQHAAAVNFFDLLLIEGKYQAKPAFPFTPGREAAGVIEAVGAGVSGLAAGDRVLADIDGAYAEYSVADAGKVFPIPDGMAFPEAAGFMIVYQTSYYALHRRAALQPGEWLLVHAGASGVGMAAIQLGKALGARVLATAGSDEKLAFCREQGADQVNHYRDGSWVDWVKQMTGGRGADVVFDPVGGEVFERSTKCMAAEGRLLVVGFAGGRIPSIAANRILLKNISVVGVYWGRYVDGQAGNSAQLQEALNRLYLQGKIKPVVSKTYPLAEAPRALEDIASRKVLGKAALLTTL